MATKEEIDKGIEIRDTLFGGNPYAELKALREAIFALYIKQDVNATQEQKDWADAKIEEMLQINSKIINGNN